MKYLKSYIHNRSYQSEYACTPNWHRNLKNDYYYPPPFPNFFGGKTLLKSGMRVDSQSVNRCNHCAINFVTFKGYVASPNCDVINNI